MDYLGKEIDFPTKTTVLEAFDFSSLLNIELQRTSSKKT